MQQQLQARISTGQVYVIHSAEQLSYVIRNSEFTGGPESKQDEIVRAIEKDALHFLNRHRNYGDVKIYFLGNGPKGIDRPYICRTALGACRKPQQGDPAS
jgi:hypothetical protein